MEDVKEFMIAVKNGMTYHFGFIKIDEEHKGRDESFYFNVVKNSFPTRENVNVMITKYRQESEKTLYVANTSEELQAVFEKRKDLMFGMIFENSWRKLKRLEKTSVEE